LIGKQWRKDGATRRLFHRYTVIKLNNKLLFCYLVFFALAACSNNEIGTGVFNSGPVAVTGQESSEITSPNIIYILTDDQGWTSVSYREDPDLLESASDFIETPNMAALAEQGLRFSNAYAPNPICAPTRHAMLFGQRTTRHVYNQDETWIDRAPQWLTIPKVLKAANPHYRTAHFGKWHIGMRAELAGFDFSDGLTDNSEGDHTADFIFDGLKNVPRDVMDAWNQKHGVEINPPDPDARDRSDTFYTDEDPKTVFSTTVRASDFIREAVRDDKPFYAYIAHYATHRIFSARQESYERFKAKQAGSRHDNPGWAAMAYDMDSALGLIMDLVEELGIGENTYIVVMGDNGGIDYLPQTTTIDREFNILGTHRTKVAARNAPLRGGKHHFYEGGIRVPFIVKGPSIDAGVVSHEPITGVDLLPTFAHLAGYQGEFAGPLDGESFAALLDGDEATGFKRRDPTLIFHQAGRRVPNSAVREGRWKLVKHWDEPSEVKGEALPYTMELYDLETDLGEKQNLSTLHPDIANDLHNKLLQHIAETGSEFEFNDRPNPMNVIMEREGLRANDVRRVPIDYVSPYQGRKTE
tara:strand:+ start:1860 stop:3605 length:1746 start_codon:yes stop_codon:yes gene_type:complete